MSTVTQSKRKNKNNEYCGSGIGLDLVRYLTELHDGTIELISEENKGSEFIINIPIVKNIFGLRFLTITGDTIVQA